MPINYDSRGAKPVQFGEIVPQGQYILKIISTELAKTGTGRPMVKVVCVIDSPKEYAGQQLFHNVTIIPANQPGAGIAIHFLKTIGQPWEEKENLVIEPADWVGGYFKAFIIQEPYTKPDLSVVTTNKIKSVMPVPSDEIPF